MDKVYDLVIVGAGPAGLSASIYASRYKLDHLVLGVEPGGQMTEIGSLENYPGFTQISGREIIGRFIEHVEYLGMKLKNESVWNITQSEGVFSVETSAKKYQAKTIILAMGAEYKKMNIPGEKELTGKGVSYCATCDAPFFKDKIVSVIGGGNSAAVVALELVDYAKKVYLVYKSELSADPLWLEKIEKDSKIEKIPGTQLVEIKGENKVEKIVLDKPYQDRTFLEVDGVFIEIGSEPGVQLAKKLGLETDDGNYIKVKEDMSTNIPGIFAAGDITTGSNKFRQVLTACAEGSIAANSVYKLLKLK